MDAIALSPAALLAKRGALESGVVTRVAWFLLLIWLQGGLRHQFISRVKYITPLMGVIIPVAHL